MKKIIALRLPPKNASNIKHYKKDAAKHLEIDENDITRIEVLKKSIDARKKFVMVNLQMEVWWDEAYVKPEEFNLKLNDVSEKPEVIIVGAGPAGLFAALKLIEKGLKPIIFERGKDVSERKRDIQDINTNKGVNPDSNYCFGEGGAGTFSDGKLYTRSKKRGDVKRILDILKFHGAGKNILSDAHPHIGTNKLPGIIVKIRESIINAGGEVRFNTRIDDFIIENNTIKGVVTQAGDKVLGKAVILATGHSARDIFELLHKKNILLEAKSFAMGVRVEHPQGLIDSIQYSCKIRSDYLPAAAYNLVSQVNGRGVYSFCMCPGGFIVPASTAPGETVVNGMSPSKRNSKFANSGMVVEIKVEDFPETEKYGVLAGLKFQENLEKTAFLNGGNGLIAPAQRLHDFVNSKLSPFLPETSYHPGVISSPLHFWLPEHISKRLQIAFKNFGKRMKGFLTNEAILLGVESRTSSPIRIPRDKETLQHPQIKNLYPCGEGAGYAGGIISSAVDGERCAEMINKKD
ncbi:MAG: FAD-binding protein [Bacteroidales bacterium]|nr:FAD-binding protein [Bacteroidales bacterium]